MLTCTSLHSNKSQKHWQSFRINIHIGELLKLIAITNKIEKNDIKNNCCYQVKQGNVKENKLYYDLALQNRSYFSYDNTYCYKF